jgi:PAS domain S-box-containing protein
VAQRAPRSGRARVDATGILQRRLRETELRLLALEERHDALIGALNEGVYDWNLSEDRIAYSESMARALALPPAVLQSAGDWRDRIHPDDLPRHRAALIDHLKGRTARFECDIRYRALDGSWRWARQRGVALRDVASRAVRLIGSAGDITELKRTEAALKESEERYALATRAATEGIYEWNVRTGALFITERARALFGLGDGALTNQDWNARIHPEDFPRYRAAVIHHIRGRSAQLECEYRVRDASGAYRWVLDRGQAVRDESGRTIRLIGAESDITLRKRTEIELRQTRDAAEDALAEQTATAEILSVISASPTTTQPVFDAIVKAGLRLFPGAAIAVALPEGGQVRLAAIADADPDYAEAWRGRFPFPLTREYMHGTAILDGRLVDIPDAERAREKFDAGIRSFVASGYRAITIMPMLHGEAAIGTISVLRRAAGPVTVRQIALLQTFANQAVIAIENARLFNETREALEQQKASGEVLSAISSSIADTAPVFDKILESCQRLFAGRIVGLNLVGDDGHLHIGAYHGAHRREFERIYPLPMTEACGSGLAIAARRIIHYPDTEHGPGVPASTRRGCRAIGAKSVIFAPLLWQGRGLGAIFVGRDRVSDFSDREMALLRSFADQAAIAVQNTRLFNEIQEKSRQLEAASRHKSEFLANMSHELRTPLNAIIGFTRIVMRRCQTRIEPLQYDNLEKILVSGQHLLALINSILDLSKIEAGRVEVRPAEIGLGAVLEQCVRTVEPLIKAESVALVRDFADAPMRLTTDEEKLRQIVINLLSNAAKFTERGTIRVSATAANGAVAVAVSDTGVGIPADKIELIFEEFEQVDTSSTRIHGGTGLGLAIARRLARLMGGDIRADSAPGKGSTFTLILPQHYRGAVAA